MHIVSYSELDNNDRHKLYKFIKSIDTSFKRSEENFYRMLSGFIFNKGKGVLLLKESDDFKGIIYTITKDILYDGNSYILNLKVDKNNKNALKYSEFLIKNAVDYCNSFAPKKIKLTMKGNEEITELISKLNFKEIYSMEVQSYTGKAKTSMKYSLVPLKEEDKYDYLEIYNKCFKGVPNCGEKSIEDIEDLFNDKNIIIGFFKVNEEIIGVYELSIESSVGWIDGIAIQPIYRGRGYGREILNATIELLKSKSVKEYELIVCTDNKPAYNLYNSMGFKIKKTLSTWFELVS